ncbi:hypothetical protein DDJ31_12425 [Streptomyces griseoviridis]|uniref:Uncharacterized protein n=1 Tax=Streptomyces griseoviridis TaxID=45398 RepID=A0ABX5TS61_STRGD|nr:hypothetical protein DDJ31_12425 [Streptomyces griseoviridis]
MPVPYGSLPRSSLLVEDVKLGKRLSSLAAERTHARVSPEEAAALTSVGIPLRRHSNGSHSIEPSTPKMSQLAHQVSDSVYARAISTAYGLDGPSQDPDALIPYGFRPSASYTVADVRLGKRMASLASQNTESRASPEEAAALTRAGILLRTHPNGSVSIDPAAPKLSGLTQQFSDSIFADAVRTAYGLDGQSATDQAPITHGYLPSSSAEVRGVKLGQRMFHLSEVRASVRAGPEEAAALTEAGIPLVRHSNGTLSIDPTTPRLSRLNQSVADLSNALAIRQAYGLVDRSGSDQLPIPYGFLPKRAHTENGVKIGQRLANLVAESTTVRAGPEEAAALTEAGIPLVRHPNGNLSIDPATPRVSQLDQRSAGPSRPQAGTGATQLPDNAHAGAARAFLPQESRKRSGPSAGEQPARNTGTAASTNRKRRH